MSNYPGNSATDPTAPYNDKERPKGHISVLERRVILNMLEESVFYEDEIPSFFDELENLIKQYQV